MSRVKSKYDIDVTVAWHRLQSVLVTHTQTEVSGYSLLLISGAEIHPAIDSCAAHPSFRQTEQAA